MPYSYDGKILPDKRILLKNGLLSIAASSQKRNAIWIFYFEGNRIAARIDGDESVRLIDRGEKFARGDWIEADFEIRQKFDESINAYVNKSYKVIRIIRRIARSSSLARGVYTPLPPLHK
jgi:hypothetical protein